MTVRFRRIAIAVAVLGLAACNAFPDSLLEAIASPDGGIASPTDSGGGGTDSGAGEAGTDGGPASRYVAEIMKDDPVAYLRFNEAEGATVAHDETVHGHHGQYSGPGLAFGTNGALAGDESAALTFVDGSSGITMPGDIDFDQFKPFSVELWFRTREANTALGFIVDHARHDPMRTGWSLRVGDSVSFERWLNDDGSGSLGKPAPAPEQWHHVVAVFDGTAQPVQQYLYLDAQQIDTGGSTTSLPSLGTTFSIGRQNCGGCGGTAFIGDLDELAIYAKALSVTAIQRHFAAAH